MVTRIIVRILWPYLEIGGSSERSECFELFTEITCTISLINRRKCLSIIYFGSSREAINSISGHNTLPPQNTETVRCCFRTRMYTRGLALYNATGYYHVHTLFPGWKVSCFIFRRWSVYSKYIGFHKSCSESGLGGQNDNIKDQRSCSQKPVHSLLEKFKISFSFENMNSLIVPG